MWHERKLQRPGNIKESLGFPTLFLGVKDFWKSHTAGLYGCEVKINNQFYSGAMYYGPRLNTGEMVLELYLPHYHQNIKGDETIHFRVLDKIRNSLIFKNLHQIKGQIRKDLKSIVRGLSLSPL